eukprot:7370086-Alexandrium_andersonii.AAC.1
MTNIAALDIDAKSKAEWKKQWLHLLGGADSVPHFAKKSDADWRRLEALHVGQLNMLKKHQSEAKMAKRGKKGDSEAPASQRAASQSSQRSQGNNPSDGAFGAMTKEAMVAALAREFMNEKKAEEQATEEAFHERQKNLVMSAVAGAAGSESSGAVGMDVVSQIEAALGQASVEAGKFYPFTSVSQPPATSTALISGLICADASSRLYANYVAHIDGNA